MKSLIFKAGNEVVFRGRTLRIDQALSFTEVILRNPEDGEKVVAKIAELEPVESSVTVPHADSFTAEEIAEATAKKTHVERLIARSKQRGELVKALKAERAEGTPCIASLYRWQALLRTGGVAALVTKKRGVKPGSRRIDGVVDSILDEVIAQKYLCPDPMTPSELRNEVLTVLSSKGLKIRAPHINTVRSRLRCISEKTRVKEQEGAQAAEQKFSLNAGTVVADYPLETAQVDHTLLKVTVVTDDEYRLPIGPAWVTVVFDVYSRVVLGIYVSLDAPSAQSVGEALVNAILPKENWLKSLGMDLPYPVWGKPTLIHADNGPDFRSETIAKSCELHRLDIHWRPVAHPNWGGHIEAYMKTLYRLLKELPGAFKKGNSKSKKRSQETAAMTLREIEIYLVRNIIGRYHESLHSGIDDVSPISRWKNGLLRPANGLGLGLPERIVEEEKLRIDFWPLQMRTIGPDGAKIGRLTYYDTLLNTHVGERMPGQPNRKKRFMFRRDNRNIKYIHLWDESEKLYHKIPAADLSMPEASLWEWQTARKKHKADHGPVNEDRIVRTLVENRDQIEHSKAKTKLARRTKARHDRDEEARRNGSLSNAKATPSAPLDDNEHIEPFEDVGTL